MIQPILFAFSFLSLFGGGPRLPDTCPVVPHVVNVVPLQPGFVVDHEKTRVELGAMMGLKAFPGFYTQGVTEVAYGNEPRVLAKTFQLSDGRWCAPITKVNVSFGLTEPADVHIAKEIPQGSCRYVTVLAHEMRHVAISQDTVTKAVDDLQAQLEQRIDTFGPAYGDTEDAATDNVQKFVGNVVSAVTDAHISNAKFENAMIDTRASYEELKNQCPDASD